MSEVTTVPRTTIEAVGQHEGKRVQICGWVYQKRSSGSIHFLQIRDGSGLIQGVVLKNEVTPELFAACGKLTQESSVVLEGDVRADTRAPSGYEITVRDLAISQLAHDYPITPKEHGVEFLMDNRHLWLRSRRQHAILRVRAEIIRAIQEWLDGHGFLRVDSPILTPSACEGTTTLFETPYFDTMAYLTQSGQLYNEATAMAFGKVYCFGPTFRAEKSKTRRHLMEFWMVEPEVAFCDQEQNQVYQEELVSHVVQSVLSHRAPELKILERDTTRLAKVKPPFPHVSYDEAIKMLQENGKEVSWGDDFGGDEETVLANLFETPFFVHSYPVACKAFYMKARTDRPEVAACADMLAPEGYGEIIGGGQREDDFDILQRKIEEHKLPMDAYTWYLDLRRYGSCPHAGFGLGIERTVAWICGLDHVRETIPFARLLYRISP
ncbi:MAG TPA: asparagine--tRNA ligase [Candidatus Xenobia bacterium]|jgi:asparaginyl-tRNA synthetase